MTRYFTNTLKLFVGGLLLSSVAVVPTALADVEWEERTPYYEDDAWYDVSEWFDGNDYNPTDEVAGRLDDETYDAAEDINPPDNQQGRATDSTAGNDDRQSYGYDQRTANDNWFYDHYDDGYAFYNHDENGAFYDHATWYYDYDGDGWYDAYYSFHDWDGNGTYEDIDFYTFADVSESDLQRSEREAPQSSQRFAASGTIENTKTVKVRGGERVVAMISREQGGNVLVDLGPAKKADEWNLQEGTTFSATGPAVKVGDKMVLLAKTVELDGQSHEVPREGRSLTGLVADTKKAQVRGKQHQMVILQAGEDNNTKFLVDLGPADSIDLQLNQDDEVTVKGAPVKVKDKRVVIARSITRNGETTQIDRRETSGPDERQAARPQGETRPDGSQRHSQ